MTESIKKRSGQTVKFNKQKIQTAISKANRDVKNINPVAKIMTKDDILDAVEGVIKTLANEQHVDIETVQDTVEKTLMFMGFYDVAKSYILYRKKHQEQREATQKLMEQYKTILSVDAAEEDFMRENANINTNTPMGQMLKLGTEGAKVYANYYKLPEEFVTAEREGWIHKHDEDFSFITFNCLTQDLSKLFKGGFNTGHGFVREPNSIRSYASLACIAIQASQNSCFGGQAVSGWDFTMAEGVRKSFKKTLKEQIRQWLFFIDRSYNKEEMIDIMDQIREDNCHYSDNTNRTWQEDFEKAVKEIRHVLRPWNIVMEDATKIYLLTCENVKEETFQAMEAAIHNFCTLHSRAGSQVPFSSINYGLCTSPEGRLVTRMLLDATWNGLGNGETPVFPIQIFQLKAGVNYNSDDINYDLFKRSIEVSAKRLYPNWVSVDASYNLPYYKPDDYRTAATTMGLTARPFELFDKQVSYMVQHHYG